MESVNTASEVPFPCLCVRGKEDRDVEGLKCGSLKCGSSRVRKQIERLMCRVLDIEIKESE